MKKNLLYIFALITLLFGCKKNDDYIFDESPDARVNKALAALESQLTDASNGWKVLLFPTGGKGYGFYMSFNKENRVTMYSDFNDSQGTVSKESSYRLKAMQQPALIFDTYSYIHYLSDPDPSVNAGTAGQGLNSDFEFGYSPSENTSTDTIKLFGRFKGSSIVLIKATADEAAKYKAAALTAQRTNLTTYVSTNSYSVLELPNGSKQEASISLSSKSFSLSYLEGGQLVSFSTSFGFTANGLYLKDPIGYAGKDYYEVFFSDARKLYYLVIDGKEVYINPSATPLIPIYFNINKTFDIFSIPGPTGLPGSSTEFSTKLALVRTGLLTSGYNLTFQYWDIEFNSAAGLADIIVYFSQGTSMFAGVYNLSYTLSSTGEFKFTYIGPGNGNAGLVPVQNAIAPLMNHFRNDKFTMDYYNNAGNILGIMKSVENPTMFFTGNLE